MQLGEDYSAKFFALLTGVSVFAYIGFEHLVANSALFVLALFLEPQSVDLMHTGKNFFSRCLAMMSGAGSLSAYFTHS